MADMTFKANLLPVNDLGKNLGASNQRWNVYGELYGNATTAATATKLATARNIAIAGAVTGNANFDGSADITITTSINHNHDSLYSKAHTASWNFTTTQPLSNYVTFDQSNPTGAPSSGWYNGFISSHNNYLASYIVNEHRTGNWYVGYGEYRDGSAPAPTWYQLLHSGNYSSWTVTKTGSGASGTWGINITGNATTATYLKIVSANEIRIDVNTKPSSAVDCWFNWAWSNGAKDSKVTGWRFGDGNGALTKIYGSAVYGAVWNDYAEMRNVDESIESGRCVREVGNGKMVLSTERLERGCKVISDTYGFNIGETEECKTPIAVSGRVLVYLYEGREYAKSHIGWPVSSGPDGTVSVMSEEEEIRYPSRIIGTISEIPEYETWGTGNVQVNNRIWIYVR